MLYERNENLVYINNGQRYGVRIVSGWMYLTDVC